MKFGQEAPKRLPRTLARALVARSSGTPRMGT